MREKPVQNLDENKEVSLSSELEVTQKFYQRIINRAEKELALIRESLKDLVGKIISEKPDYLVFIDKGARIFGTPFAQFLAELGLPKQPMVHFFNDDKLKESYLYQTGETEKIIKEQFGQLAGKKLFFIDEIFSHGKGAAAIAEIRKIVPVEIFYFALSEDNTPRDWLNFGSIYPLKESEHRANLDALWADPHFTIYPNKLPSLFSADAADIYVTDIGSGYRTRSKFAKNKEPQKKNSIPSAYKYLDPPPGMTWDQFAEEEEKLNLNAVKEIKNRIFSTLMGIKGEV